MFFKILQKLREKSEGTRKLITIATSVGLTAIIATFWAMSYVPYANNILNSNTASVKDALSDFGEIKDVLDTNSPVEEIKETADIVNNEFAEMAEYVNQFGEASSTATTTATTTANTTSTATTSVKTKSSNSNTTTKATSTATTSTKILVQ